jgi:DNA-binding Xre family transcriptional regulator
MINLQVKKLMLAKGISQPHAFLTKQGMNPTTATKILRSQCKNLKVAHLELLCWHINCTPSELFEWVPDKKHVDLPGHALQQIRAQNLETDLPKLLKKLTKKQLTDLSSQAVKMLIQNEGGKVD